MRNNVLPTSNKHQLKNVGLLAGICEENCGKCDCRKVVAVVLHAENVAPEEVLATNNISPALTNLIHRTKAMGGQYVEEREDYLDIDIHRPISDSFLAVSDDEL